MYLRHLSLSFWYGPLDLSNTIYNLFSGHLLWNFCGSLDQAPGHSQPYDPKELTNKDPSNNILSLDRWIMQPITLNRPIKRGTPPTHIYLDQRMAFRSRPLVTYIHPIERSAFELAKICFQLDQISTIRSCEWVPSEGCSVGAPFGLYAHDDFLCWLRLVRWGIFFLIGWP